MKKLFDVMFLSLLAISGTVVIIKVIESFIVNWDYIMRVIGSIVGG